MITGCPQSHDSGVLKTVHNVKPVLRAVVSLENAVLCNNTYGQLFAWQLTFLLDFVTLHGPCPNVLLFPERLPEEVF